MVYVLLGGIGFGIIHLFDFVSLKNLPVVKPFCWIIGCSLLIYSGLMTDIKGSALEIPAWLSLLGWVVLLTTLPLLIYSLFINLPFRETYVNAGVGKRLITTGFYALARHPGVITFAFVMMAFIFVTKSSLMIAAAIAWIILDVVLVVIQDKFIFVKMFSNYKKYQQETPMLIPNTKSIRKFISQINLPKSGKAKEI